MPYRGGVKLLPGFYVRMPCSYCSSLSTASRVVHSSLFLITHRPRLENIIADALGSLKREDFVAERRVGKRALKRNWALHIRKRVLP